MTNLVQFPGLGLSFEINRVALSIGGFNITGMAYALPLASVWRWYLRSATASSSAWTRTAWWT